MENKQKNNRRPSLNKQKRFVKKEEKLEDEVVYTTRSSGPVRLADWQLQLKAMSDCYDMKEKKNYKELVQARFEELKHKRR